MTERLPLGPITKRERKAGRVPLTKAERSARWRETHPEKVAAYHTSERRLELQREATRRWRAKHPKTRRVLPLPPTESELTAARKRRDADFTLRWKAKNAGFAHCIKYQPCPTDSKCQNCGAFTKLHLDHNHATGAFRGWLCLSCNMGIGQLGDDVTGLERALSYLKREGHHG